MCCIYFFQIIVAFSCSCTLTKIVYSDIMCLLFPVLEGMATMGIDLSAITGFVKESGTLSYHSFYPLSFRKPKAINPGSGRSPVSRRLISSKACIYLFLTSSSSLRLSSVRLFSFDFEPSFSFFFAFTFAKWPFFCVFSY